jgi:hypothetical protein
MLCRVGPWHLAIWHKINLFCMDRSLNGEKEQGQSTFIIFFVFFFFFLGKYNVCFLIIQFLVSIIVTDVFTPFK